MEDLEKVCRAWARGDFYPMSFEDLQTQLDPQIDGREEAWWSTIFALVDELGRDELRNLTNGPMTSLIRLQGEPCMKRIEAAAASGSDRWATVYCDLLEWSWEEEGRSWAGIALDSLGEGRTMRTWGSRGVDDWDTFWSWEVVNGVATGNAPEVRPWPFLIRLLEVAETNEAVGDVGAGPLEDFLRRHIETHSEEILAEETRNAKLRRALRGIYWPVDTPVELVERLKAASNEPRLEGEALRMKAEAQVNREVERVTEILNGGLEAFNSSHPYARYPNIQEAALAALAQAAAVLQYAEGLGLIDHYRSPPFVTQFLAAHPDLRRVVVERLTRQKA